jgi:hypothetical protein
MAIEPKRGCGFRKVGGLYLVGGELMEPCDRLPFELGVCRCCGGGIKPARGWTWIEPAKLFYGNHEPTICHCQIRSARNILSEFNENRRAEKVFDPVMFRAKCPACEPLSVFGPNGQAGLLWIGEKFYTPQSFNQEALDLGISRRINSIPRDFVLGKTYVFFAHRKAVELNDQALDDPDDEKFKPGIFAGFLPKRIEKIVKQSDFEIWATGLTLSEEMRERWAAALVDKEKAIYKQFERDAKKGITFVPVPDDDPDHNPDAK